MSGIIDLAGEIIVPFEDDHIAPMPPHTETIVVCKAGKWGELNPDGSIAYPLEYAGCRDMLSTLSPYLINPVKI